MTRASVYLDHNASTPLLPEARAAMIGMMDRIGNPSSVHAHGRALYDAIEVARDQVARAAGAVRDQVVFTGSATEAITQAIVAGTRALGVDRIVISAAEHAAVARAAQSVGVPVTTIGLDADGVVRLDALADAIAAAEGAGERLLVAVHLVNNETGVIQPLGRIEAMVGPTPHYLFVDAVQAFGKLDLDFGTRATDMMAIGAHKVGGPAGVGALLMKAHLEGVRLIPGGGQEQGRRGGTSPAMLIAGFGAAAAAYRDYYERAGVAGLVTALEQGIRRLAPDAVIFGANAERLGNVVDFATPGLGNAVALMALDLAGISVSSGSACSSGKVGRSAVLKAMGVPDAIADCALRVSLGWTSRQSDVDAFLAQYERILARRAKGHGKAA